MYKVQKRFLRQFIDEGIGLTPEGIHSSYVMSDLMLEMAWRQV